MIPGTKRARRAIADMNRTVRRTMMDRSPPWLRSWLGPVMLHADMLFVDHGIFRTIYLNKHKLDGEAIRAAQPTPGQIRRLARRGLRTMVNLRGERDCGSYWLEKQACDEAGIVFETFRVRSRAAPTPEEVLGACELFRRVEYPMLMHCKSGADRVGLMSVLYQFVHCGVPLETAKRQLSLRYGHIRQAQTGVLDYFFETYMAYNQSQPIDFLEWVSTVYDHKAVMAEFRSHSLADKLVDGVLRRE